MVVGVSGSMFTHDNTALSIAAFVALQVPRIWQTSKS